MAEYDLYEGTSRVIAQLTAAITNASLYSPSHTQVAQHRDKAYAILTELFRVQQDVTVIVVGNDLVAANRTFPVSSFVDNFVRMMKKKGVERLTFTASLSKEELQNLIRDLASLDAASIRSSAGVKLGKVEVRIMQHDGQAGAAAAGAGTSGVGAMPGEQGSHPPAEADGGTKVPAAVYEELLALNTAELENLKELYLNVKKHKRINVQGVDDMVKGFIRGFRQELNPLSLLASLKSVHEYTFTHVTNVCILTMSLAESLGFRGENLHQMGVASLLHDVGKLFIPEEILNKAGKLSQDERAIIETHTVKGARYLLGLEGIPKLAVITALEHHLKYDGTGYPSIKGGWTPNIGSQIICVADVFDAMRSKRSYQEAMPIIKIEEIMRKGSGKSFNPVLIDHFMKLVKR
jgi:HD-GYP domain-containing protein (c-di-GMP phosphodiesterase class II)